MSNKLTMKPLKRTPLVEESSSGLQIRCTAGGACGKAIVAAFPVTRSELAYICAKAGWYLSGLSQPGAPGLAVCGPVCDECAPKVYDAELFKAAEEARLHLLATGKN